MKFLGVFSGVALGLGVTAISSAPACALSDRVLVSAKSGADTPGCGAPATPCRTFQFAHDETNPGGQISVMDPGFYDGLQITKSISIVNDGAGPAIVGGNAGLGGILISALGPSDRVYLRGLTVLEVFGARGINVGGALGSLTIVNCAVRNNGEGIRLSATGSMSFIISDSVFSGNGAGIAISGTGAATGVIQHVNAVNNGTGVAVSSAGTNKVTIADSVIANNTNDGVYSGFCPCTVWMRDVVAANNGRGFTAEGGSVLMRLAHSVAVGHNTIGVQVAGGTVESHGDNNLRGNGINVAGSLTVVGNQ